MLTHALPDDYYLPTKRYMTDGINCRICKQVPMDDRQAAIIDDQDGKSAYTSKVFYYV